MGRSRPETLAEGPGAWRSGCSTANAGPGTLLQRLRQHQTINLEPRKGIRSQTFVLFVFLLVQAREEKTRG